MKPSIRTISQLTGFSPATVSNALNNKKGVNKETAQAIFKAARACGYFEGARVSAIKFVVWRASGLVVADTPFFAALIEGVETECRAFGFEVTLLNLSRADADYDDRLSALLNDAGAALLILATEMGEADAAPFKNALAPVVMLDNWFEDTDFDSVLINNTDSVCKAVEHLAALGHRHIGYLAGSLRIKNFFYREAGYRRALDKCGLACDPAAHLLLAPTMEGAHEDMARHLRREGQNLPTAFFADNDIIALGAMKALRQAGVDIPGRVSLIGFDDLPFGAISTPPLSTIRVFKQEMGQAAVRRLMELARGGSGIKTKTQICTEFIPRASVQAREKQ